MTVRNPRYGLSETDAFRKCAEELGNYRRVDEALVAVTWAFNNNPHVYEVVGGMEDVRLLKTDSVADCPALRIWFRIDEEAERLELLYFESIPDDNDEF